MDKIKEILINEGIIHVLDNTLDKPLLNEYTLDFNEDIYRFVYKHVDKVLKDNNLKYSVFSSKINQVKEFSQKYLTGERGLVISSMVIAEELFKLMKTLNTIPSCDLMVVSISTEFGPMLGILKLDYVTNYTHEIKVTDDALGINITPINAGLPTNKKVSKAAFIKPIRDDQEYDLLVLDKDYVKDSDDYGFNYFVNNFLGCNVIENDRDKTKAFIEAVEIWTRSNIREDAAMAEKIRAFIKNELKENDSINIYDLSNRLFYREPEAKKVFTAFLQSKDIEEFAVDKEFLDKKLSKVKLKIGSDIELSITEDAYKDINKFQVIDNRDGSIHLMIKNVDFYLEK